MAAADTNVLLRLLSGDDERQAARARKAVAAHGPLFISHIVLVEAIWVLKRGYEMQRDEIAEVVEELLGGSGFILQREAEVAAALALFRTSSADFSDCLLLENARSEGELPVLTFDKALAKLDGARVV